MDTTEVVRWITQWLAAAEIDAGPHSPILGEVDSLRIAGLLAAAEARWDVDVSAGFAPGALADVTTLATHLCAPRPGSPRRWFASGAPGEQRPALPRDGLLTTSVSGEHLVGLPVAPTDFAGPLGSALAVGDEAVAVQRFADGLHAALAGLGVVPVWYPILTDSAVGADHPQNVDSAFPSGRLPHAACLQFVDGIGERPDGLYAGVGYAFRREPARRWEPAGRLEAYRVFEIVGCAGVDRVEELARAVVDRVAGLLAATVPGQWCAASDGFSDGMRRKLEWMTGDRPVAVASFNDHGTSFTGDAGRATFCVGVGLDRLLSLGVWR
ncbi:hypothetical protein [Kitasatospora sp. NPDC057936]|uniref:hypothetical protein n=1 Tax=Kitasatospora sp. NPDC057936 TaxID=3346283 RepID=UPI0036DE3E1E